MALANPPSTSPLAPTIFHQPWWLDAVSDGAWRQAEVHAGGQLIGRLPYLPSRRFGQPIIGVPALTHFLGPAIDDGIGSPTTRQLKRIAVTRDLIAALPSASSIWLKCHRGVTDTLAFQQSGFRSEVQFTCEIAAQPESAMWAALRDTARRVIRRAADRLTLRELTDAECFFAFYESNLAARGLRNSYRRADCLRAIAACTRHQSGRILVAVDDAGGLVAGIFTIWDDISEYYLMSTRRADADNGAISLLLWAAILHAAAHGFAFDLDGVSTAGDVQFLTRFGGVIRPRYFVHRSKLPWRLTAGAVQRLLRITPGRAGVDVTRSGPAPGHKS